MMNSISYKVLNKPELRFGGKFQDAL